MRDEQQRGRVDVRYCVCLDAIAPLRVVRRLVALPGECVGGGTAITAGA
jgi:hypothetical protein